MEATNAAFAYNSRYFPPTIRGIYRPAFMLVVTACLVAAFIPLLFGWEARLGGAVIFLSGVGGALFLHRHGKKIRFLPFLFLFNSGGLPLDTAPPRTRRQRLFAQNLSLMASCGDYGVYHAHGGVSVGVELPCSDSEFYDADRKTQRSMHYLRWCISINEQIKAQLPKLGKVEILCEVHSFRERDSGREKDYLQYPLVRKRKVGHWVRQEIHRRLAGRARANQSYAVFTVCNRRLFARSDLKFSAKVYKVMKTIIENELEHLPGTSILSWKQLASLGYQSLSRDGFLARNERAAAQDEELTTAPLAFRRDAHAFLAEQIVRDVPRKLDDMLKVGNTYVACVCVDLYPEEMVPFQLAFLQGKAIDTHIMICFAEAPTEQTIRQTEKTSLQHSFTELDMRASGVEAAGLAQEDFADFREAAVKSSLPLLHNLLFVRFSSAKRKLVTAAVRDFEGWLGLRGGTLQKAPGQQLSFYRLMVPTQASLIPRRTYRTDLAESVACLLPLYGHTKAKRPEDHLLLYLDSHDQRRYLSLPADHATHAITIGQTGSGKDVQQIANILQTYPAGWDWLIAEVDPSFKATILGLGGNYIDIDPKRIVLNPLPPPAVYDAKETGPLVTTLAYLFYTKELENEWDGYVPDPVRAAMENGLDALYARKDRKDTPILKELFEVLKGKEDKNEFHRSLLDKMDAFFSTKQGDAFNQASNLNLSSNICGVNLRPLTELKDKRTLLFYLLFLLMEFSHRARRSEYPTRILLNEYHAFVDAAPKVIASFVRDILRTGRKYKINLELTTQTLQDILARGNVGEDSTEQIRLRRLLYVESDHAKARSAFGSLPQEAVTRWGSYPPPELEKARRMMYSDANKAYDLNLLFPDSLLRLGSTAQKDLMKKERLHKRGVKNLIELSEKLRIEETQ